MYDRGSIPETEEVYFARDLMSALAPPEKDDPYALDFSEKKIKQIEVDPLVEPDYPVMERPKDHTKTKPYKKSQDSPVAAKTAPVASSNSTKKSANVTAPSSTNTPVKATTAAQVSDDN